MRPLLLAALALTATTAAAAGTAHACTLTKEPYAQVLGDAQATGDRPLILIGQLPPDAPWALTGPSGDVELERHDRFVRPRAPLDAGAEYRVAVRGGGRDRVLARFTVAPQPSAVVPSWRGVDLVRAGLELPRTTCEAHGFAVTVTVRTTAGQPRPEGYLYVYDRQPRAAAPLRGLRGIVPSADGELQLGRVGVGLTFEPRWDAARPPRTVWIALGDAAGHVGKAVAVTLPRRP